MRATFDGLLRDLGLAARRLLSTPLFLIFAVGSIAIGIATTTAAYSILYAILWRPLGINQPEDVVVIGTRSATSFNWRSPASIADFEALDARQKTLDNLSALVYITATLQTPASSETANFEAVTGRLFRAVRIEAARGRTIQPEDDERAAQVIVLSDWTWRTRFSSDPAVVGKAVRIGGRPFEIIGVAPESLHGLVMPVVPVSGWMPMRAADVLAPPLSGGAVNDRSRQRVVVLGRLAAGRALTEASSEIEVISATLDVSEPTRQRPLANGSTTRLPRAWSLRQIQKADDEAGRDPRGSPLQANVAILLLLLVGLVLIVACTNLGNLNLSRGAYRQHELAVRRALGATRWRLVRELSAETIVIAALASVVTLLLTRALLALATVEISMPVGALAFAPRLNVPALAVSALTLAVSMLVFGLEPALALTGRRAMASLADGVSTFGAGRKTRQRAFIRWQVAISVGFFLIAAAIVRGIATQAVHDPGFALNELAIASIGDARQATVEQLRSAVERAAEIARQRGDLTSVAVTNGMPFGLSTPFAGIALPGTLPPAGREPTTTMISASPEFFRTLGVPIVRGRQFDDRDRISASHVAVVSEWTATHWFGGLDAAVGRTIDLRQWLRGDPVAFTVIGVARETDVGGFTRRGNDLVYVPLRESVGRFYALVARTTSSPAAAARALQDALRIADPDIGSGMSGPATWVIAAQYLVIQYAASVAGSLGLLTLILAMIGLYGVQAQAVVFRTREMGIRMALGAAAAQITRMVLGEGIRPVIEGVVLGCFFGVVTRAILRATLLDETVRLVDFAVFGAVPIPFAIAALIACYLPARRAASVDPNVALRHL
jgi:putative ABC transport system permease protein